MRLAAVIAVSENNVIGAGNAIPWRISSDLQWFRKNTMGKPMIMGRRTFESLPGPLSGRTSIILTRATDYQANGALVAHSVDEALKLADLDAKARGADEIAIIGGSEIYQLLLPHTTRFYLTRVHAHIDGDTFFPPLDPAQWTTVFSEFHTASEKNQFNHTFQILDRIGPE
jgi:dihydrofolate reductase